MIIIYVFQQITQVKLICCQLASDEVARMEYPSGASWQHSLNNMGVREFKRLTVLFAVKESCRMLLSVLFEQEKPCKH